MATALTSAARLKPEVRLGQAISEFQIDLSMLEKATFRSHQKTGTSPRIRDVMQLTAEINRSSGLQGRCFGSRLTNILQAVQEFASLGDVVLGASQSLLACGVWALVRMTLLAVVKFSTYFEQLSSMFMTVGRSAPRYQLMGAIYPTSQRLRSSMLEYFITVVQLCHHVMKLSRKTVFGQWAASMTNSLKGYQSDLELWAATIKEEVNLLMAQQLSHETEENSWFRSRVTRRFESQSHARRLKTRQCILDACSTYDHEHDWKRIRKLGKTTLLKSSAVYSSWKDHGGSPTAESRTLVCTGKLGSGKTVILANMVDDLYLGAKENTRVAYYFCQHDSTESLTPPTVIGSLARQLLQPEKDLDCCQDLLGEKGSFNFEDLPMLLERVLSTQCEAFIILDGLMHCEIAARQTILEALEKIQTVINMSLCLSIRLEPADSVQELELLHNVQIFPVGDQNSDIDAFITTELERCVEAGSLAIDDPTLVLEIQESLSQGAHGMFLWVALQIKALCYERTDADIRKAISNLPSDLTDVYTLILKNSAVSGTTYQIKILELIATVCRPLTTEELREALSVVPWLAVWDPRRLMNDINATLACCGGLLTIDEEISSVRMVHPSVRTFLCDALGTRGFDMDRARQTTSEIIVTYLNYGVWSKQLSTVKTPKIGVTSVASTVIKSTAQSRSRSQSIALRLLRSRKGHDADIGPNLMQRLQACKTESAVPWAFYQYADEWWQEHIGHLNINELSTHKYLTDMLRTRGVEKPDSCGRTPLSHACEHGSRALVDWLLAYGARHTPDFSGQTPLFWAVKRRHISLLDFLLDSDTVDPNTTDESGNSPLLLAIFMDDSLLLKCFLDCDRVDLELNIYGLTPLMVATILNHEELVEMLISSAPASVISRDGDGSSSLHYAAKSGHVGIFKLLFNAAQSEDLHLRLMNTPIKEGDTPLWLAAANGHLAIIEIICKVADLDPDVPNQDGETPFWIAAAKGHVPVVKLLGSLSDRVNVNRFDNQSRPALWAAVHLGHEGVVAAMLAMGDAVDVNCKNVERGTPLTEAVNQGAVGIVRILAGNPKVDVNYRDYYGMTPLWRAAHEGHDDIVSTLVLTGRTDLNSRDSDQGVSSLWTAAARGHSRVVTILTKTVGVDVNASNSEGMSPLWAAAHNGHVDVVAILAAHPQIDLNQRDATGRTPLGIAAKHGNASTARVLASLQDVDLFRVDPQGKSALRIATQNGHEELAGILRAAARSRLEAGTLPRHPSS